MDVNLAKTIESYYASERLGGVNVLVVGLILLGASFVLWKWGLPSQVAKGMLIPVGILAVILLGAGTIQMVQLPRSAGVPAQKSAEYQSNPRSFLDQEVPHVERIRSMWLPLRLLWTFLLLVGVGLIFIKSSDFRLGIAVGVMAVGVMGHIADAFAYERNENYAVAIIKAAKWAAVHAFN